MNKYKIYIFIYLPLFLLFQSGCIETMNNFAKIPPGKWRGELVIKSPKEIIQQEKKLLTQKKQMVGRLGQYSEGVIPFEMEIKYKENGEDFIIEIINGEERIVLDDINYGWDKRIARDTMIINFPIYQSYLELAYEDGVLQGDWHVKTREKYKIPFRAKFGKSGRFNDLNITPKLDISGKWATVFSPDTQDEFPAIGEFKQEGNKILATFATESGDFRYLEGTLQGNNLMLSTFDGSHAFLFTGTINEDESMEGKFFSGTHYETTWKAKKDNNYKLRPTNEITYTTDPTQKISFELPNEKGTLVNLNDEKYNGKAKVITLMGTWCPNCIDETKFLVDYLKSNNHKNLAVFALSYEKNKTTEEINKQLKKFKERYHIPYEVLNAGPMDKKKTLAQFPMLNNISSYPTTIYLDKYNNIKKIYTGFYGPATSEYKNFVEDFDKTINTLINY